MYRTDVPDWVKENMQMTCKYCGSFIADNSDTGVTTSRWCVNPYCPGHMAHKMKFVADYFNVKNFGPATALSYCKTHNCKNHLEILKEWYKVEKPLVSLADVATLACIEGYGETQAKQELNAFGSFKHYFANVYSANNVLLKHKDFLIECEQYFNLKPPLAARKLYVMATGSFNGYTNRDEYFKELNDAFGNSIQVIQVGKRKNNVDYLVKEKNAVDHSKSKLAEDCGIPTITPKALFELLYKCIVGE